MQLQNISTNPIWSEDFGEGRRHYFFDIKKARNNTHYLRITRSDKNNDGSYTASRLILFEEDIGFFVEAIAMLLGRYVHENSKKEHICS